MKLFLKWFAIVIVVIIVILAVLSGFRSAKNLEACNTDAVIISIVSSESEYPKLRGLLCNVPKQGEYNLVLWPSQKENGIRSLGKQNLPEGTQYFRVAFDEDDSAWASPQTGDYTIRLFDAETDEEIAVSDEFHITNTSKVEITNFIATPTEPQSGQAVTLAWEAKNATRCTLSKDKDKNLVQLTEDVGTASYSEVVTQSTYYQLICFGKDGRIEGSQLKGDFDREFKWVLIGTEQ